MVGINSLLAHQRATLKDAIETVSSCGHLRATLELLVTFVRALHIGGRQPGGLSWRQREGSSYMPLRSRKGEKKKEKKKKKK